MKTKDIEELISKGEENAIRKQDLLSKIDEIGDISERTAEKKLSDIRKKWYIHTRHPSEDEDDLQKHEVLFYYDD